MIEVKGRYGNLTGCMALLLCALATACGGAGKDPILGSNVAVARPTATATAPPDRATDVSVSTKQVVATFSEPMNPLTGGAKFALACAAPCVSPTGTAAFDITNTIATLTLKGVSLAPGTEYTASITGATSIATGLALENPLVWTFTTAGSPDVTAPSVTSTIPATTNPGPTLGTPVNSQIVASFTEDMAESAISGTSFTVTCASPCVSPAGAVSYVASSRSAVFKPTAVLDPATTYTATITNAASDISGNPLASNYVWTFTTGATADSTRPAVILTVPATTLPGPTPGVATNTAITAVFSEDMSPATIDGTSFTLTCALPCTNPSGAVSYVASSRTAVFSPATALSVDTVYTATVAASATDLASNALAGNQGSLPASSAYIWTFRTGAAGDTIAPTVTAQNPVNGAVGICTNKKIHVTFSEAMDPLTVTAATFTLKLTNGGTTVTGGVTYDALTRIATFIPTLPLIGTPATSYTVTVVGGASGVKDLAGNALAISKVTTFNTNASACASAPALGAAAPFGSFGGNATLTNDGLNTIINGDVGANAASSSITGFHDSGANVYTITTDNNGLVNGLVYTQTDPPGSVAGVAVTKARADALLAFNSLSPASLPGGIDVSSLAQCPSCGGAGGGPGELAGRTLPPGVYKSTIGTYDIGGLAQTVANLTLDAGGDADAVWVFQSAAGSGTLNVGLTGPATPAVPIKVLLINGAQSKNVFWYAPAGAAIGTGSTMEGTILADASITFSTTGGSPPTAVLTTLNGRAIALTAGVTLTNTIVNIPAP